jgi:hypothetical protein
VGLDIELHGLAQGYHEDSVNYHPPDTPEGHSRTQCPIWKKIWKKLFSPQAFQKSLSSSSTKRQSIEKREKKKHRKKKRKEEKL